ncbi:Oidioi.mRNA.OKI2018_I69.PAR.g12510.t1.cds [Oikopleura dioica]|uniref:Oidioi.mRNA.OKI2018_I69.PAR.g12510.t1.cds n=1 Tax=Oikopleura dioica TaxID=34765 RepID=A0ABN7S4Y9_OIKDI|nr:Oidioi.mRNA.OKI2018_I69.PAR.g12510.t1.cds [Oikopleura dioica]
MLRTASKSARAVTAARAYHAKVHDHFNNPRNIGSLDKNKVNVGTGMVGAPACGDVMKLMIEVDDDGKIIDAKFKTFGCGSAIASSSLATEMMIGKHTTEAQKIKNTDIATELSLPPVKLHCSVLAEDAIKAAVRDIANKKKAAAEASA